MTLSLITPDGGEILQVGSLRTRVLEDGSGTAGRLGIVEVIIPPGDGGPPQHTHREHEETFFVLSGTVRFSSAREHTDARPGSLLTAPIGLPHTFGNPDPDEPAVLLGTVTPDRYINYFRELAAITRGGNALDHAEILKIMSRYATDPYPPR